MSHGGFTHRGLSHDIQRSDFAQTGVFGRLFPKLDFQKFDGGRDIPLLERLAATMKAGDGGEDNRTVTAGYTFLGQFIDHDITFDPTSSLERQNDPEAIYNFRTPLLELDSVYGSGPAASPHLYDQSDGALFGTLLVGHDSGIGENQGGDLPRNWQGTAIIGDPRNDENLIVSQLHLAFLKFHNRVLAKLAAEVPSITDAGDRFLEAQRIVRWHYQWLVVEEFLPRIIGFDTHSRIFIRESAQDKNKHNGGGKKKGKVTGVHLEFIGYEDDPFIPVEFAVAAYRFGHSMIRPGYSVNKTFAVPLFARRDPAAPPGTPNPIDLRIKNIQNVGDIHAAPFPGGQKAVVGNAVLLNASWPIDWARFFEMGPDHTPIGEEVDQNEVLDAGGPVKIPQFSKKIDTKISSALFRLNGADEEDIQKSLAFRNLLRGATFNLPWGQNVANKIVGHTDPRLIQAFKELKDVNGQPIKFPADRVPLWYYILKEAEVLENGLHLGPVGGRIVGEVLAALLVCDAKSYLAQQPGWTPAENTPIQIATSERFTVGDFINFAQGENVPAVPVGP